MIEAPSIRAWRQKHPWSTAAMVEQDMVISRALIAIFSDAYLREHLAFRGGTALHKLYLHPQPRYSEDIDLVQIHPGPIREMMDHLRDALSFLGEPRTKSTPMSNKLLYRFDSEIAPVEPMRLKVEINCREHFHVLPWAYILFSMSNSWFSGECSIRSYAVDELLGTKLRALYQRKKGRDLFDLSYALQHTKVDADRLLTCFCQYMIASVGSVPSYREFCMNMEEKLDDTDFLIDTQPILIPSIDFDAVHAYPQIRETLLCRIDRYRIASSRME